MVSSCICPKLSKYGLRSLSSQVLGTCPINNLIASASRMGTVPPLVIDVIFKARFKVCAKNKKVQKLRKGTKEIWMTDTTCGYPRVPRALWVKWNSAYSPCARERWGGGTRDKRNEIPHGTRHLLLRENSRLPTSLWLEIFR